MLRRLAHVDALLAEWADYDAHFRRAAWARPFPVSPALPRLGLRYVRALLVDELCAIDGAPARPA